MGNPIEKNASDFFPHHMHEKIILSSNATELVGDVQGDIFVSFIARMEIMN